MKPREMYKKRKDDKHKREINSLLASLVGKKKRPAIVLDARNLNTKNALVKAGFPALKIHIPNPFDFKAIRKKHRNTYAQKLGDFLNQESGKHSLFYADYCCTVDGNADMKPMADIQTYFRKQLADNNSYFAFTFSYRNMRGVNFKYEDIQRIESFVEQTAFKNGYAAIKHTGRIYSGMFFGLYNIKKL